MSPAEPAAGAAAALETPIPSNVTAVPRRSSSLAAMPALAPPPPDAGRKVAVDPLPGSADALVLAQLATRCASKGRIVAVIAADALAMQRLAEEIPYFAPDVRVASFPDWETLPYDHFSPHHDLVSARLATLYQMGRHECDVVLIAAQTALYRLPPRSYLAAHTFFITSGESSTSKHYAISWRLPVTPT
jgi:transcription-repair coupling factor (superfamily II helicase)